MQNQPLRRGPTLGTCKHTGTRTGACACRFCAGRSPTAKYETNKRDALALLDLIAGCIENHPRSRPENVTWANVGDAGYLRERLTQIAVGFALGPKGSQYASSDYRSALAAAGMICSMSAKGRCYDNAVAESFFHSLKVEIVHGQRFASREQAMSAIFKYMEVFYNRKRLHSVLDYVSPADYEQAALLIVA